MNRLILILSLLIIGCLQIEAQIIETSKGNSRFVAARRKISDPLD